MQIEIDYLPVGGGERSGDAIAMRFGENLSAGQQTVVVIDGGTKESGTALVEHIRRFYNTTTVDAAICTHCDCDHASGLTEVLEKMTVRALVMHRPWNHAPALKSMFRDTSITLTGIERKLVRSLQHASTLEDLAVQKRIPIYEPFAGVNGFDNTMTVLGPTEDYYRMLVANFDCTPEPAKHVGLLQQALQKAADAVRWLDDALHLNLLDDVDRTSAQNNSSAIILFQIGGQKILFTGDAGITALTAAADYAASQGIPLDDLSVLDVPHHGSKRNAGRSIYQRIKAKTAFISAAKDSPKHPSKKVTNALFKNGTKVFVTRGMSILHRGENTPSRPGWDATAPVEPFHPRVEE